MAGFAAVYGAIAIRLVLLGFAAQPEATFGTTAADSVAAARPELHDRNGELLAADIRTASLYAEPIKLVDPDEAVEKLASVLTDLDVETMRKRFRSDAGFVWVKREIPPKLQAEIHRLGIPGIGFVNENRRIYPGGPTASHIIGHVDIDNKGIAGIEKYIDGQGLADLQALGFATARNTDLKPVRLSIDLRVQHVVRDELVKAMEKYKAIAAAGIVLDVATGEVVGMSSLPDYDPNEPADALKKDRINRCTAGVFELGSTFKTFTTAMALDSGKVTLASKFDARSPIRFGRYSIDDFHGKRRVLTVPEVFIFSSNIGTAKMAQTIGIETQRAYFGRFGLLDRLKTELPEIGAPILPSHWSELASMTISFGHGISVSPMQAAV
ncbi:MAG: penicillin-binding protein 2, partial [Hyphomicrobiales bacterium]|nr:penicillin-binding protein 2 [Hyphomicrobiales bacterium]